MSLDKIAALYIFCADFHDGQWSRLYQLSCRIDRQYRLKLTSGGWNGIRDEGEDWRESHEIYKTLVGNYCAGKYHSTTQYQFVGGV